jgi:hypothetical protein
MVPLHITIPQPKGPDLPIINHDVKTVSKMLGAHFSSAGETHLHMLSIWFRKDLTGWTAFALSPWPDMTPGSVSI